MEKKFSLNTYKSLQKRVRQLVSKDFVMVGTSTKLVHTIIIKDGKLNTNISKWYFSTWRDKYSNEDLKEIVDFINSAD